MSKQISRLNRCLLGWRNYFLIANGYQLCADLDQWIPPMNTDVLLATIRRQWRKPRTKGINQALTNEYLATVGLLSLRNVWVKIHYGSLTALCGAACTLLWGWRVETSGYPIYTFPLFNLDSKSEGAM
jgi:RNA-directed DNA polymerase